MNKGPKILLWDIETSYLLGAFFQRYNDSPIPYASVFQEWFVISAQFKWLHEKKTTVISVLDNKNRFNNDFTDDYIVIKTLRDLLDEADIVVAHNGDHFDWKKFKAKLIYHKISPPRRPKMIDTYKEAKSSANTSNKLGDLCEYYGLENRKASSNFGDWLIATLPYGVYKKSKGKKLVVTKKTKTAAIKHIAHEYGKYDIPALESLYLELRPYMFRHPNLNEYYDDGIDRCTNCKSCDLKKDGSSHGKQKYKCNNCGKPMYGKLPKVKRSKLKSA
jgi:hypothetical protein